MPASAVDLLVAERRKARLANFRSLKRGSFIRCGASPGPLLMVVDGQARDVGDQAQPLNRNGDPFGSLADKRDLDWRLGWR